MLTRNTKSYFLLADALHRKEFYWIVPNDDNRIYDGKALRTKFIEESPWCGRCDLTGVCSMLELLIGVAGRCVTMATSPHTSDTVSDWFWQVMSNVGLDRFTDECWMELNGSAEVDRILTRIIDRTYHRNGRGGLFPLKYHKLDQRKTEIWYQMAAWFLENYYKDDVFL